MILTFIVPMVLIIIFGNIFGGSGGIRGRSSVILVNESNSVVARLIEAKLDSNKSLYIVKKHLAENGRDSVQFDEPAAKDWVINGKISAAVVMGKDFFTDTSSAVRFKFYYDPKNDIESAVIQGAIQQTIFTQTPKLMPLLMRRKAAQFLGTDSTARFIKETSGIIGKYFDVSTDSLIQYFTRVDSASLFPASSDSSAETNFMKGIIDFDQEQLVGKEITNPGLTRTVGGWAMMFLLFSLTGASTSLFEEKQEGTLKRLLCMPVRQSDLLWSKYLYTMGLGVVQLLVLFIFAWAIFKVDIFSNFGNLMIVIIASSAAAVAFGMLITSLAKSLSQASGISTLLILVMSALGGSWFPINFLPDWMQVFSKMTINYWSVEAFLNVLWRQSGFSGIAVNVAILLIVAVLVNSYALIRFKNGRVF